MPFGVSSGIPNVIIHAKFHVDRLRGFWAAGPPKVPFPILIGTTLTTDLHYRADCDSLPGQGPIPQAQHTKR